MPNSITYDELAARLNSDPELQKRLITQTDAVLKEFGITLTPEQLESVGMPEKDFHGIKPQGWVFNKNIIGWEGDF
jgi:hypothetical protein